MWFLSTCAALRTRTRTVNAVFSTFVLRAYDFIEFADAMPPLTSPFRVNTRRAKYHTISFPPFPPGRLGSTLHSHLKMGRHGASRSNSLSPFPFPSLILPFLPCCLADLFERRFRDTWRASERASLGRRDSLGLAHMVSTGEYSGEGARESFSRAAFPKFKLKHRPLLFCSFCLWMGRKGGWSGGRGLDRPTETGRGGRPLPYYTRERERERERGLLAFHILNISVWTTACTVV